MSWSNRRASDDDMLFVTWAMVEQTLQQYPIDPDRIVLAGVSAGGNACWEMAMRHPGRFAAIAPIASAGGDSTRASLLVNTLIWAFNNVSDTQASIDKVREMVTAVRDAGGRAKLSEIPNIGHAAWVQALYENLDLLAWLLSQHRNESFWDNYFQFVDWQHVILQCGLPLSIGAVCMLWLWRRRVPRRTSSMPRARDFYRREFGSSTTSER
jgi:pimeloyl-ACP methyl ester carboxylesterase